MKLGVGILGKYTPLKQREVIVFWGVFTALCDVHWIDHFLLCHITWGWAQSKLLFLFRKYIIGQDVKICLESGGNCWVGSGFFRMGRARSRVGRKLGWE